MRRATLTNNAIEKLSKLCYTAFVYERPKGKPKDTAEDFLSFLQEEDEPLLIALDVGETMGIVVMSKSAVFLGQAHDRNYYIAGEIANILDRYWDNSVVLIESGFCPSAEAIFRSGVAFGAFNDRRFSKIYLVHPNAKPAPAKANDTIKSHFTFFCLRLLGYKTVHPVPSIPHCASAFGLILKYLRDNKVDVPIDEAVRQTEAFLLSK